MSDCIFCKIIAKQLPAEISYEDEDWLVISDIQPQAPLHLLFLSKKHHASFAETGDDGPGLVVSLLRAVYQVAEQRQISDYRLLTNVGADAGQTVRHLHWHFLAGGVLDA